MGIIAEAVRHMLDAGMTAEAVVAAVAAMESASNPRTARQERNRRYYAKASEKRLKASYSDDSDAAVPLDGSDGFPQTPFLNLLNPPQKENPKGFSKKPPNGFVEFRENFPKQRPGSWQKAEVAYVAALKRGAKPDEINRGVLAYAASEEVLRGFAKGAAAWLNDDRWLDDYSIRPQARGSPMPPQKPKITAITL